MFNRGLVRQKERLIEELHAPLFYQLKQMQVTNGKFHSNKELLPPKTLLLPASIAGRSLNGKYKSIMEEIRRKEQKEISLVKIYSNDIAKSHCDSFNAIPFDNIYSVLFFNSSLTSLLAPMIHPILRWKTSPDLRDSIFIRYGRLPYEARKSLGIINRFGGYVIAVDGEGWIRWIGSGKATDEELNLLQNLVNTQYTFKK